MDIMLVLNNIWASYEIFPALSQVYSIERIGASLVCVFDVFQLTVCGATTRLFVLNAVRKQAE